MRILGFLEAKKQHLSIAIQLCAEGVALLLVDRSASRKNQLKEYFFYKQDDWHDDKVRKSFRQTIKKNRWGKIPCYAVLAEADYQLLLIESPAVPADERREAVRWKIKDLVSFNVEEAVIDVFPQPVKDMLYVVATTADTVQKLVDVSVDLGLSLQAIDIPELSFRNYIEQFVDADRACTFVVIKNTVGRLCIFKGGNLYLSRSFSLNYGGGLTDPLPEDDVVLEIQRSLDYYERQLGEVQPDRIVITGDNVTAEKITDAFRFNFTQIVEVVPQYQWLPDLDAATDFSQVIALYGAAMRNKAA